MKIDFSSDQFSNFMTILYQLKDVCSSLTIQDGKILQENDKHSILYDIDLSSIVGGNTIMFDILQAKFNMLDIFKKQNSKMNLEITDKKYIWSDKTSKMEFAIPMPSVLLNKPISKESNRYKEITAESNNKIFECIFDTSVLERFSAARKAFDSNEVMLVINEDISTFVIIQSGNNSSMKNKVFTVEDLNDCSYKGFLRLPSTPFEMSIAENMNVSLSLNKQNTSKMTVKFNTELVKIPFNMWCTTLYNKKDDKKQTSSGNVINF